MNKDYLLNLLSLSIEIYRDFSETSHAGWGFSWKFLELFYYKRLKEEVFSRNIDHYNSNLSEVATILIVIIFLLGHNLLILIR